MANKLNQILCATGAGANTGVGDCPYQMGPFLGGFITPRNFRIPKATAEDPALLQTFLKNATMAPIGQRIYPIHGFVGMPADNSADDTTETFGYGRPIRILEGNYNPQYQHYDGGVCLHKNLRKFNKRKNIGFLFYDNANVIVGTNIVDEGARYIGSVPLIEFNAQKIRLSNGTNTPGYFINLMFAPKHINEDIAFVETTGFDITSILGLQDVYFEVTKAANDVTVKAFTSCGGVDLYDLYKTEFANEEAWVLTNGDTGAAIVISTVTANDGTKSWTVASATALPTSVTVNLADPSVLAVAPVEVEGYEGIPATV